jgi:hypothetical protein
MHVVQYQNNNSRKLLQKYIANIWSLFFCPLINLPSPYSYSKGMFAKAVEQCSGYPRVSSFTKEACSSMGCVSFILQNVLGNWVTNVPRKA